MAIEPVERGTQANPATSGASSASSASSDASQSRAGSGSADSQENGGIGTFAAQEVHQVLVATSSFVTTIVALLASAFGVVAALAWNKVLSDWLQTVKIFDISDPLGKEFADAVVITVIAIVIVTFLGIIASRVRGTNLLVITRPDQSKKDSSK